MESHDVSFGERVAGRMEGRGLGQGTGAGVYPSGASGEALREMRGRRLGFVVSWVPTTGIC